MKSIAATTSTTTSTGALSFVTAPDFELPTDAGGNNVYDVTVQASDGHGGIDTQAMAVTVENVIGSTVNGTTQAQARQSRMFFTATSLSS